MSTELSIIFLYYPFNVDEIREMILLSFLILLSCVSFFSVSLARGLSNLLVFFKNQIFGSVDFSLLIFLFLILLLSALVVIISFLLIALGLKTRPFRSLFL